jgi:thiosulfate/3-mercaptopyruvate sulfurtransferase
MSYIHPEFLISAEELAQQLDDQSLRIFDTSVLLHHGDGGYKAEPGREQYLAEHIAGAGFINLSETWSDTNSPYSNTVPELDSLCAAIGNDGIGNDNPVVLYSSSHLMWATRAWWLLRYAGHNNVRVLNGNLGAWVSAGLPTRSGEETYPSTNFTASARPELFVSTQEVAQGIDDATCTINALPAAVYEGTGDFYYGRKGHIPGSRSLPFADLLRDEFFLPANELHDLLSAHGMLTGSRTMIYCGGGIAATLDGFACMLLGQRNVGVYDGSMSEWAADPARPLKTGAAP